MRCVVTFVNDDVEISDFGSKGYSDNYQHISPNIFSSFILCIICMPENAIEVVLIWLELYIKGVSKKWCSV